MTTGQELKAKELAEFKRLVEIIEEIEILCEDLYSEEILAVSPKATILLAEADRITRKHKELPYEFQDLGKKFLNAFSLYKKVYRAEINLKNDFNRLIRIEMRKQVGRLNELAAQPRSIPCALLKDARNLFV